MASSIRRTIMLRPMHPGAGGYARLENDGAGLVVQFHARGLEPGRVRLYWYLSDRAAREAAQAQVNARGEVSLQAQTPEDAPAPRRLLALILIKDEPKPRPLLIGLCAEQSAGSMLDAKNAALALCERLRKTVMPEAETEPPPPREPEAPREEIAREVFLPALESARHPEPPRRGKPVDFLRPLLWPKGYEKLQEHFDRQFPCRLFPLPGWRFVEMNGAQMWLGRQVRNGRVRAVAYAWKHGTPGAPAQCRPARGVDGTMYEVLWQSV